MCRYRKWVGEEHDGEQAEKGRAGWGDGEMDGEGKRENASVAPLDS